MMSASPISEAVRQECIQHVTQAVYDRHAEALARFGPRGRQACSQDIGRHLDCLQAVLQTGETAAFVDYVVWLRGVLHGHGMPAQHLDDALAAMAEHLRSQAGEEPGAAAFLVIGEARAALSDKHAVVRFGQQRLAPLAQAPQFQQALLEGRRNQAVNSLSQAMEQGNSLSQAYVQIVQPAMYEIGDLWQRGRITVSQEHLASAISHHAMVGAYTQASFLPNNGKLAVFACVEGNFHELGLRMVADSLETAGWEVIFLGANVPLRDLVKEIDRLRPSLLGLSAALPQHVPVARTTIEALRAELGTACPFVWLGGLAVSGAATMRLAGADGWAGDALQILDQL